MSNMFLTFIKPYLSFIDEGHLYRKPISWLYALLAVVNLLFPVYLLYKAGSSKLFEAPAKFVIAFILLFAVISFVSWISFQLWWDRKSRVTASSGAGDDFVATPVVSHLLQTTGEWLGTWIGVAGFFGALIATIFFGKESVYLFRMLGLGFMKSGFLFIIIMPIYGFLVIIVTRFIAEQFRALSSIANNTKK